MMTDPLNNQDLPAPDPLAKWILSFQVVYALPHYSVSELSSQEPGIIRKESGEGLVVRKITAEMLKNNLPLAEEIHKLAINGHLGYSQDNGHVQFRQDIAEKMGAVRAFKVFTEDPDIFVDEEVAIDAIDHEAYTSLHLFGGVEEEKKEEPDTEETDKKHSSEPKITDPHLKNSSKHRLGVMPSQQRLAFKTIVGRLLEQLRTTEKKRQAHAAEVREADKKRERDAIKDDVLKREIIGHEIKAGHQRANLNVGRAKQT